MRRLFVSVIQSAGGLIRRRRPRSNPIFAPVHPSGAEGRPRADHRLKAAGSPGKSSLWKRRLAKGRAASSHTADRAGRARLLSYNLSQPWSPVRYSSAYQPSLFSAGGLFPALCRYGPTLYPKAYLRRWKIADARFYPAAVAVRPHPAGRHEPSTDCRPGLAVKSP